MRSGRGLVAAALNLLIFSPMIAGGAVSSHVLVFLVLVAAFAYFEAAGQQGVDSGFPLPSLAAGLALLGLLVLAAITRSAQPLLAPAVVGALLMTGGIVLRAAAMAALGTTFVSEVRVVRGDRLVTGGVYAFMRHPSETGLLCLSLGAALLLGSPLAVVAWLVVFLPLVLARVSLENRELLELHGQCYRTYCGESATCCR